MIYREKTKKVSKHFKPPFKIKTNMLNRLRGIVFCSLWYLSIIAGFFILICPILPLVLISPKKYRRWSDVIFGMWEPFPVAMMEVCLGIRVVLSGDKINPFESSLFIMNHRTRVDWTFLWLGLFHCCQPNAHNIKYILKAPIMKLPGPGWVMQTCSFIFVHRNWAVDEPLLDKMIDYLNESDELYQILLFPEGTDLTENGLRKSHKYADEHNLERYYNVLHPRTTGFNFLVNKMKSAGQLKAVYDVTIAYPKTMPLSETDLIQGKFPEEVHFHVKRYNTFTFPTQDEEIKTWLTEVWREKELKLQRFYISGRFNADDAESEPTDYGAMNMKNGSISYRTKDGKSVNETLHFNPKEIPTGSFGSLDEPRAENSEMTNQKHNFPLTESKTYIQNHMSCDRIYRSKNYRPSHLLYLVLVFWITLIVFTVYELFNNFYLQLWVLIHSLLFVILSYVSNGFHLVAASIYFYRYEKRSPVVKKQE